MTTPSIGSPGRPLRVAVVGAGPAGFYTVEALLKHPEVCVDIDLIERLPAPYGLLRYGVAPDHPKIKSVSVAYDRLCEDARVRFLGNVGIGNASIDTGDPGSKHLRIEDLVSHYDQVVLATGCETDRRLGIEGEDLAGSHCATSFVAWYNGHPDFTSLPVELGVETAVIVGIGDVAMDLARMLLRDPADLASTDIAANALETFQRSRIRRVVILARRGPAEATFAAKELEDITELPGLGMSVDAALVREALAATDPHDAHEKHKLEVLARLADGGAHDASKHLEIRFLASPAAIVSDAGRVSAVRFEHNELAAEADGRRVARGTGRFEEIPAGLVLRSVGYLGVAIPGVPFDDKRGIVPNSEGRVLGQSSTRGGSDVAGAPMLGLYVAGWIKRGATGVVGTNKGDAASTVMRMLEDLPRLPPREAQSVSRAAVDALLCERSVRVVSWEDWKCIDRAERERGAATGKVREKFTRIDDMLKATGS